MSHELEGGIKELPSYREAFGLLQYLLRTYYAPATVLAAGISVCIVFVPGVLTAR